MTLREYQLFLEGRASAEENEWTRAAWSLAYTLNAWKGRKGQAFTVDRLLKRKKAPAPVDDAKAKADTAAFVAAFDAAVPTPGMTAAQVAQARKKAFVEQMRAARAREK